MSLSLTPSQLPEVLIDMARIQRTVNILGSPGMGKTHCVEAFIKDQNLFGVDIVLSQYDSVDLLGYPMPNKETGKMSFLPIDKFVLEGEKIPGNKDGVCIFLDEINAAPRAVAAAAYRLILERKIGQYNLHPNTIIVAAGNLKTDKAIVNDLGTAMQSKMITVNLTVSVDDWLIWALHNGIDQRVMSFIKFQRDKLHKFDPNNNDDNFACPRTWNFLSDYIKTKQKFNHVDLVVMSGCVSEGPAVEFNAFCKTQLPSIDDIIDDPAGFKMKNEPSFYFAMTTVLAFHIQDNPTAIVTAIERLPIEFQAITMREAVARNKSVDLLQPVQDWYVAHADQLF